MKIEKLNGGASIFRARTEIRVPYLDEMLVFEFPIIGRGSYQTVMRMINKEDLAMPTMGQLFSLIDIAQQNPEREECREIIEKLERRIFYSCTQVLKFNDKFIVYDNADGRMPKNSGALMEMYDARNKAVRVAQTGFVMGTQNSLEIFENHFLLALIGDDRLLQVAGRVIDRTTNSNHFLWPINYEKPNELNYMVISSESNDSGILLEGSHAGSEFKEEGYSIGVRKAI